MSARGKKDFKGTELAFWGGGGGFTDDDDDIRGGGFILDRFCKRRAGSRVYRIWLLGFLCKATREKKEKEERKELVRM